MKLFTRRKKTNSNLPPEIQAYAQAEHRERMGMAWLVGLISLIVTVLVLVGLYFGGRWVYRKLAQKDKTTQTSQADKKKAEDKSKDDKTQTGKTDTNDSGNSSTDTPVQAPAAPSAPAPATQPATGDNGAETLVRTGPDIDL